MAAAIANIKEKCPDTLHTPLPYSFCQTVLELSLKFRVYHHRNTSAQ